MRKWTFALLLLLMFLVTAHITMAQVQVVDAYVFDSSTKRTASLPTGLQYVNTAFYVQGLPANSVWKLSYYNPDGSLVTTSNGSYNNSTPQPGVTYGIAIGRFISLTKGDWHIQLAINGQTSKDIYFSAGLAALVFDHAIVIGSEFLTEKTVFSPGVNQIGGTVWVSNLPAGWWMRLRYQRPDGTIAADNTWDPQYPNGFNSGSIGLHYFVNLDQIGTWHLICDLDGQTVSIQEFNVVLATSVLLVHGTWSGAYTWDQGMLGRLQREGYTVEALDFRSEPETQSNETYIELQAKALARRVKELQVRSGNRYTDLVCHSMGGLAARYYLEHPKLWLVDSNGKAYSGVRKLIMLGTPNWGTDAAFLDPVFSVVAGRFGGKPYGVDKYDEWSPAIKEQFAEWEPAPTKEPSNAYSYPQGFKLGEWKAVNHVFQSPIQTISYNISGFAQEVLLAANGLDTSNADYAAITAVDKAIPLDPRTRFKRHAEYYTQAVQSLVAQNVCVAYPMKAGIEGVGYRIVSTFLATLNATQDTSSAQIYMVGATKPIVIEPSSYISYIGSLIGYLIADQTTLFGPFNTDLGGGGVSNDGVVPTDSELGFDPITGKFLYPQATRAIFNTYHTDLPSNPDVINQVVEWLRE